MITSAQRAPFAGSRPNGYKDRLQPDNGSSTTNNIANNGIADRFGGNTNNGVVETTQRLPHLALGDREVVDRLNTFPIDQRPFWLINAEAIEAQKNQGRPTTGNNQNVGEIGNRFGSNGAVSTSIPNYPTVVYPIQMTSDQRQQAQLLFHKQIQQITNNNQPSISNTLPNQMVGIQQKPLNNSSKQIPLPVQGRLTHSGYGR